MNPSPVREGHREPRREPQRHPPLAASPWVAAALALGALAMPAASFAGTIATTSSETWANLNPRTAATDSHAGNAGQAVQASAQSSNGDGLQTSQASASAYAAEGILRASVWADADSPAGSYYGARGQSSARAVWTDALTIGASGLFGQSGYITATLDVTGFHYGSLGQTRTAYDGAEHFELIKILATGASSTWAANSPYACGGWNFCAYEDVMASGHPTGTNAVVADSNIPAIIQLMIPVTFGLSTHLSYTLDVTDLAVTFSGPGWGSGTEAHAVADYGHTLTWGGITGVFDAAGNQLSNFTAISGSGFDYLASPTHGDPGSVPEPASFALLGLGLAGLTLRRRQRAGCRQFPDKPVRTATQAGQCRSPTPLPAATGGGRDARCPTRRAGGSGPRGGAWSRAPAPLLPDSTCLLFLESPCVS